MYISITVNDPTVDVYWHDQLHHPITKFHICRLGEGQTMNRFINMQVYSVLQYVTACFSVLQCGAVWCSVVQCGAVCCRSNFARVNE